MEHNDNILLPLFCQDVVGALDVTHIDAVICDADGVPFRNRRGTKSWNVLACCSFDRIYTYVNVGWVGSAHNVTMWKDSLTNSKFGFPHPPDGKLSTYLHTLFHNCLIKC